MNLPKRLIILFSAVMLVSIAVVQARHESRQRFAQLQAQQSERDALNVEWVKLLLEEGAWSQHRRIELMARNRLDMRTPEAADIRVLRMTPDAGP